MNEKNIDPNNDIYKALGHFVVEFSRLLYSLETSRSHLICPEPNGTMMSILGELAGQTASPIISSFFSVFYQRWEEFIMEKDEEILKTLRGEINEIVTIRNRLMHDVWFCNFGQEGSDSNKFCLQKLEKNKKDVSLKKNYYYSTDIEKITCDVNRLSKIIYDLVWYHPPELNTLDLCQRFEVINKKIFKI